MLIARAISHVVHTLRIHVKPKHVSINKSKTDNSNLFDIFLCKLSIYYVKVAL